MIWTATRRWSPTRWQHRLALVSALCIRGRSSLAGSVVECIKKSKEGANSEDVGVLVEDHVVARHGNRVDCLLIVLGKVFIMNRRAKRDLYHDESVAKHQDSPKCSGRVPRKGFFSNLDKTCSMSDILLDRTHSTNRERAAPLSPSCRRDACEASCGLAKKHSGLASTLPRPRFRQGQDCQARVMLGGPFGPVLSRPIRKLPTYTCEH